MRASAVLYPLLVCASAEGFTARSKAVFHPHRKWHLPTTPPPLRSHPELGADGGTADADRRTHQETGPAAPGERLLWAAAAPAALALWTASPAEAADVVPSALWAYGHYLSMLLTMGALVAERVLIKPEMSSDEEKALRLADLVYVGSLVFLIVTGSLRATEFGKGFDFYSHEILFWLKMSFAGVLLGCSLFPSITLYRRGGGDSGSAPPMSEKLAKRMTSVLNAEISGVVTIPLLASFVARGATYSNDFPWPAGLVLALAATGGACYYYGKQAVTWEEDATAPRDPQV